MTTPTVGRNGYISLHGIGMRYVPGSYTVKKAPRFGEKLNIGPLKYADFSPFESAFNSSNWSGGYGLARFSDVEAGQWMPNEQTSQETPPFYLETDNVDCREPGIAQLSPAILMENVTGAAAPLVWQGEIEVVGDPDTHYIGVCGAGVYERDALGAWAKIMDLPAVPRKNCVLVFNGVLFIGYGVAHVAQYTIDLISLTNAKYDHLAPLDIYAFAATSDHSEVIIAGGALSTDHNSLISSADSMMFEGPPVLCGSTKSKITALAPGGGVALVFVGKEDELGSIDTLDNYHTLVPFDSRLPNNCTTLRWWMGSGGDEQRGPLVMFFNREDGIWTYQPSAETSGSCQNATPWSKDFIRPPRIRGEITAIAGSARWLYTAVKNDAGYSWVLARDSRSGAYHTLLALGATECRSMNITAAFGGQPVLIFGVGTGHAGSIPIGDNVSDHAMSGSMWLPDIDFNFPGEPKLQFKVQIVADGVVAGSQDINVYASFDGGAYRTLGPVAVSPSGEVEFPQYTAIHRLGLRVDLSTNDPTKTPKLRAVIVTGFINSKIVKMWAFTAIIPEGTSALMTQDLNDAKTLIDRLWSDLEKGFPVPFEDIWNERWLVRLYDMTEKEVLHEGDEGPAGLEMHADLILIGYKKGGGNLAYDSPLAIYDADTSVWG